MPSVVKGSWTAEEDMRIEIGYRVFGSNWAKIAASAFTNDKNECTRTMVQIRERYMNVLSQKFKLGGWTAEDNELLQRLAAEVDKTAGLSAETKAWRVIAKKLQRTAK